MTVVGTRPEIIRLSCVVSELSKMSTHTLVHNGQNYDFELSEVFFEDLELALPDFWLNCAESTTVKTIAKMLVSIEEIIVKVKPDAFVVLGDTNSCLTSIAAMKHRIPIYHLEAGNRAFDQNVPEEHNRKIVDRVADYNLVYSEHSRRNLLAEGFHPQDIALIGSPMNEVIEKYLSKIHRSQILFDLNLEEQSYILLSVHREENVESDSRLTAILEACEQLSSTLGVKIVASTHPRTYKKLAELGILESGTIQFLKPFGFTDYLKLQKESMLVISDSGTISEEASLLGFRAVTPRDSIERPEALEVGAIKLVGASDAKKIFELAMSCIAEKSSIPIPLDYQVENTSVRVANFIQSTVWTHHARKGIRMSPGAS